MTHSPLHLDRLRLRHLRLLQLIEDHGSLRSVAAILNLTQPAVSQMLKDLEFALGAPLVDRSVRGVVLSEVGALALQRTRAGLATFDQLARELDADKTLSLRIGTNPALMHNIIPAALRQLNVKSNAVHYHLQVGLVGDMVHALSEGTLDCYVGRIDWDQVPDRLSGLLSHDPLLDTDLILVCPADHPAAALTHPRARDLADCHWAMPSRNANNRIVLESAMRNAGVSELRVPVEVAADPNALISLAGTLGLLTCVPRVALDEHADAPDFRVVEVVDLKLPNVHIGFTTTTELSQMPELARLRTALISVAHGRRDQAPKQR